MNDNIERTEVDTATKQDVPAGEKVRTGESAILNPTGKGGFGDNPENRSDGRWSKDTSITYWYNAILRMTDDEYDNFIPTTRAQRLAMRRIESALGTDELALKNTKEITDRTEGKPKQDIDMNIESESAIPLIKGFVIPTLPEDFIERDIIAQGGKEHLK